MSTTNAVDRALAPSGIASADTSTTPIMTHRQILTVIIALISGMFLAALDQTIVGTAIRTIGDDLKGLDQQAWVTTAYLITSTIATPIYGKLSDIFGRRPLYLFGIVVFVIGSLLSSFSTSMLMLAAFRAFQGIGAGALMSLPLAIMGDILAPRERAKYQGFFLATFAVSSVIGPLIGGVFADATEILWIPGWRWVFLVNVPVGIFAIVLVFLFLHLPKHHDTNKPRIDWWGASAVVITLAPLLLITEQGREWGWTSPAAFICYAIGALGLVSFLVAEVKMGPDAIIPLRLFKSRTFSMATILGLLVGFGMFGAMLTIPLYLQIVVGLSPTESGLATLPMVGGMMIAAIASGQIVSKTGHYRLFPVAGTFLLGCGYLVLTQLSYDKQLWFMMIAMFLIGLGLGQIMQTLTLASQNSVAPRDMGVATSASTFFRQIGGTLGVAVLLSVLFSLMPGQISAAMGQESDLKAGLNTALNPATAQAENNRPVMNQLWNPIVNPIKDNVQKGLDQGTAQAIAAADRGVRQKVTSALPAGTPDSVIEQQVNAAKGPAEQQALSAAAEKAHASVSNGRLSVDWSNESQRSYWVDQVAPDLAKKISDNQGNGSSSGSSTSDTSFLKGADPSLTKPFMKGFISSAVVVYGVGLAVIVIAFILSLFFKVPPLRSVSALQERAEQLKLEQEGIEQKHDGEEWEQGSQAGAHVNPDAKVDEPAWHGKHVNEGGSHVRRD